MKNILLIIPSCDIREDTLRKYLDNTVEIRSAANADEAMTIIGNERVDLLVADLELEGISGDELCRRTKAHDNGSYVILASNGKKTNLKLCGKAGADAHLQIPIVAEALARNVSSILKMPTKRATRVLVKTQISSSYNNEPFFCVSHNISATGMMLETEQSLAKDDRINCSFYLPDSEKLSARCSVVRVSQVDSKSNLYGVLFVDISDEDKALLEEFIAKEREAGNFN